MRFRSDVERRQRIRRYTPMPPPSKPMARTRINPVSKKRRRLNAKVSPARKAYLKEMWTCAVLPWNQASEVHEIAAGSDREKALQEPATWLAVCRIGHDIVQNESKAKQLARKLLSDPTRFDLEKFNAVYTGREKPLTLAKIVEHLELADVDAT